jgi:DNA-binding NarL/FixJ family response regulator
MTTKLAVVDAAQVIHGGIRDIVSTTDSIRLVGTWEALEPFLAFMTENAADVLLLGDNVSTLSLKKLTTQVLNKYPKLKVVVLVARITTGHIEELSKMGVTGFMYKDEALSDFFVGAVHAVKRGDVYISPQTARTLLLANNGQTQLSISPLQMQVLQHMSDYKSPQEIAQKMNTSVSSIYNHQYRLRILLGVSNNGEILIEAAKRGLILDDGGES